MKKLINIRNVCSRVGFCRSKVYAMIKESSFPKPIKIGKASRWDDEDIDQWIERHTSSQKQNAA